MSNIKRFRVQSSKVQGLSNSEFGMRKKNSKAQGYHTNALGLRLEVGGGKLKDKD